MPTAKKGERERWLQAVGKAQSNCDDPPELGTDPRYHSQRATQDRGTSTFVSS